MSKIENIKNHFKNNKVTYIACGVTAVVVAGVTYYVVGKPALVNVRPVQLLNWKSQQTVEVFIEALGDPGNIVQDLTTGTIYASQNQAAKALGVFPARITEHLAGKLPNVNGHELVKLGKAAVSDAA
jgi:hypothetical protein